jgi:NAD(P)-dependent dehydrogenase (short-subunit alcohol dehydrogenase family)
MVRVLITGANGLIGNIVYAHLAAQPDRYDVYGNARRAQPSARAESMQFTPIPPERMRLADLTDFEGIQKAVEGMDVVVHMAADASGASGWESIRDNNIQGAYHIFEASGWQASGAWCTPAPTRLSLDICVRRLTRTCSSAGWRGSNPKRSHRSTITSQPGR